MYKELQIAYLNLIQTFWRLIDLEGENHSLSSLPDIRDVFHPDSKTVPDDGEVSRKELESFSSAMRFDISVE